MLNTGPYALGREAIRALQSSMLTRLAEGLGLGASSCPHGKGAIVMLQSFWLNPGKCSRARSVCRQRDAFNPISFSVTIPLQHGTWKRTDCLPSLQAFCAGSRTILIYNCLFFICEVFFVFCFVFVVVFLLGNFG